jgi:hypothetical protein
MAEPAPSTASAPAAPASSIRPIIVRRSHIIFCSISTVGSGIAISIATAVTIGSIAAVPIATVPTVASAAAAGAGRLHDDGSGGIAAVAAAAGESRLSADAEREAKTEEQQSRDAARGEHTPGDDFSPSARVTCITSIGVLRYGPVNSSCPLP